MEDLSKGIREKLLDGSGALSYLCLKFYVVDFHSPARAGKTSTLFILKLNVMVNSELIVHQQT